MFKKVTLENSALASFKICNIFALVFDTVSFFCDLIVVYISRFTRFMWPSTCLLVLLGYILNPAS